ncbi:MAG: class I SAM-dependent methyltransferase [Bacteroidales bacterium]
MIVNKLREQFFKVWYWYISSVDKNADIIFMNYGYSNNMKVDLNAKDEKNRYSIQLYHHTVSSVDLSGKHVLEVGCGRGGGLSYINRYLKPETCTGIDLNNKAIRFCNKHYKENNISFVQGDAQNLPFEANSFDVVVNVESSHRYPENELFFSEVYRVLKPGGHFLFTDFRDDNKVGELDSQLNNCNLFAESKNDITEYVLEALTIATPERENLIKKIAPKLLHNLSKKFAATVGTPTYNKFRTKKFRYLHYVMRKQEKETGETLFVSPRIRRSYVPAITSLNSSS